ncbi:MAG: hypothetical protein QNJ40_01205 [Xanthomonadales bacterium]|nr:hypothetical protein [Xanthomonadales bacterium]
MKRATLLIIGLLVPAPLLAQALPRPLPQVTQLAYSDNTDSLLTLQQTLLASEQPGRHFWAAFLSHRMAYQSSDLERHQRVALLEQCADLTRGQQDALSLALRANCFGGIIGLSPLRAMTLGSRSSAAMDGALAMHPNHPFVLLQAAVSDLKTPRAWGGSPGRAVERLRLLMGSVSEQDPWHWLLPEVSGHLAQALLQSDQPERAAEVLARGRQLAPDYAWLQQIAESIAASPAAPEKR